MCMPLLFHHEVARSSLIPAVGFGILIALIAILGLGAVRRARAIYSERTASD